MPRSPVNLARDRPTKGFQYDGLGRRTQVITVDDEWTLQTNDLYVSAAGQVLTEKADHDLVWSPVYVNALIRQTEGENDPTYVTTDLTYSVTATWTLGYNTSRIAYSAYGVAAYYENDTIGSGAFETPTDTPPNLDFGWQGGMFFQPINSYAFGARIYRPDWGRWTTVDPIRDGMNWFEGMEDNPINLTDPTGLKAGDQAADAYYSGYATEISKTRGPGWKRYIYGVVHEYYVGIGGRGRGGGQLQHRVDVISAHIVDVCPNRVNVPEASLAAWKRFAQMEADGDNEMLRSQKVVDEMQFGINVLKAAAIGIAVVGGAWLAAPLVEAFFAQLVATAATVGGIEVEDGGREAQAAQSELQAIAEDLSQDGCFRAGTPVLTSHGLEPIETIGLGRRITTSAEDGQFTDIRPESYCTIRLQIAKNGQEFFMAFLRPRALFEGLKAGDSLNLSVLELKLEARARILAIEPCPPIEQGIGRVVTGVFSSQTVDLWHLKLSGLDMPLEVTGNHPIYSLDHEEFVVARDLRPGERLRTLRGEALVERLVRFEGEYQILNMEVELAHQYFVTEKLILVHNGNGFLENHSDQALIELRDRMVEAARNAQQMGFQDIAAKTRGALDDLEMWVDVNRQGLFEPPLNDLPGPEKLGL